MNGNAVFQFYVSRESFKSVELRISNLRSSTLWIGSSWLRFIPYSKKKSQSSPHVNLNVSPKDFQFSTFSFAVQNTEEVSQLADKEGWIKIIDFLKFATGTELCKIEFQDRVFSKSNFDDRDEEKKGHKKDPKLKVTSFKSSSKFLSLDNFSWLETLSNCKVGYHEVKTRPFGKQPPELRSVWLSFRAKTFQMSLGRFATTLIVFGSQSKNHLFYSWIPRKWTEWNLHFGNLI